MTYFDYMVGAVYLSALGAILRMSTTEEYDFKQCFKDLMFIATFWPATLLVEAACYVENIIKRK